MNYTPLNIQNKDILKSDWLIRIKTHSTFIITTKIDKSHLKPFVPDHFEIDNFEGSPRLSIVVLENDSLSMRFLPFVKKKKATHIYLQTYVKRAGVPGIFYISLDTNHPKLNKILKSMSGFPIHDSKISITKANNSSQLDLMRDSFSLYANLVKKNERVFEPDSPLLSWITNRFHIFSVQAGQVLDWKIDFPMHEAYQGELKNIQFSHPQMIDNSLKFERDCFYFAPNTLRLWPPSL